MRLVIADDHAATRAGVIRVLPADEFAVCAEAADGPGAVAAAREHLPDVCLLDIHMPGGGIDAAATISKELPGTAVVMLTVSGEDEDLFAALKVGAAGYLLKDMDPDRLADALRGIVAGETAMPRALMARVLEEFRDGGRRRVALPEGRSVELSEREWQMLDGLREGRSTKEMAAELFVSPVTVRRHISTLLKKLRVHNREAAIELMDGCSAP